MAEKTENDKSSDWKPLHKTMVVKMALEKVREAIRRRDVAMLERAIEGYNTSSNGQQNDDIFTAEILIEVLKAKELLDKAMADRDIEAIQVEIDNIKGNKRLIAQLQRDVQEAEFRVDRARRLTHLKHSILDMDRKTMSEIRRYHAPPALLKSVMQAVLLLLGEHEEKTQDWRFCQQACNPQGRGGLNRKIMEFDATRLNPEIAARAKQILDDVTLNEIQVVSSGASTFYVWAMGILEDETVKTDGNPATIQRQKEIFGVPSRSPPRQRKYPGLSTPRGSGAQGSGSQGGYTTNGF